MLELYAFLAALAVQIPVASLLVPDAYIVYARAKRQKYLSEARYAQLYPAILFVRSEPFLGVYRAVNLAVAIAGLCLLGWLFSHMLRPDWDLVVVRRLFSLYSMAQQTPLIVMCLVEFWVHKAAVKRAPPEPKRTASLQRRKMFDFVSPVTVAVAVLAYILFVGFVFYVRQHPYPGFTGYNSLSSITFVYLLYTAMGWWMLYGKKNAPLETRAERIHHARMFIKLLFYAPVLLIAFRSLVITLTMFQMERWLPCLTSGFAVSVLLVVSLFLRRVASQAAEGCASVPAPLQQNGALS